VSVLTQSDREFFDAKGYVIVREAVPTENCEAVVDAIWEFLGMNRDDPDDWYRAPHKPGGGMVEMYQHQAMWDNRQHPRVHQAFADIWGDEKLQCSVDRVNFKPPRHPDHPDWDHKGFRHWDADTSNLPLRFGVQGVLFLTDTASDQGSFQCMPGEHKHLLDEENPYVPELDDDKFVQIEGAAGDLLIWNRALAHGNGHNTSDRPRLAQYISMSPGRAGNEERRQHRIKCWRERLCPGGRAFPGDPRGWEQEHNETAELTPLGRKLLGLDPWE
jgi:hypothetical protein